MKEIVLAGGCFWGMEGYFQRLYGVVQVTSGYANGEGIPNYRDLCAGRYDHAEAIRVVYDEDKISLYFLLAHFFRVVDPTSLNRQGNDFGKQYRSGLYFVDPKEEKGIRKFVSLYEKDYKKALVVEIEPLRNFYPAEEYHQNYLIKNPGGYCHIPLWIAEEIFIPLKLYAMAEAPPFMDFPEENLPGLYVNEEGVPLYFSFQRKGEKFLGKPLVDLPTDELYFVPREEMLPLGYGYLLEALEKKEDR